VLANLVVTHWGPWVSVINAFVLIGLDLTSRDILHELWQGRGFAWRMGALITAGSLLSYALNQGAGRVAFASFAAFALSSGMDTWVYQRLRSQPWTIKVNGSNLFGGVVDSIVFPLIAFGWPPLALVIFGQFIAKFAGGLVWSLVLNQRKQQKTNPKKSP
jgi:uncharacterized PurR-regulated membrane protein YhhQ (DUF165 family)